MSLPIDGKTLGIGFALAKREFVISVERRRTRPENQARLGERLSKKDKPMKQSRTLATQPTDNFPIGLLVIALLVVVLWGIAAAKQFLVPVCLSALLAFLMNPLVRLLRRRHCPEWLAVILSSVLLILPFLALVYFVIMEIQSLVADYPKINAAFARELAHFSNSPVAQRYHLFVSVPSLIEKLTSRAGEGISIVLVGLKTFFETGSQVVLILIFAVVMLASRQHLAKSGEKILAQFETIQSANMLEAVVTLIEQFLIARLVIVVGIGIASAIAVRLFGVSYSLLLGLFVGVMTLVPEIGFIISLVPVLIVALATGHSAVSVIILLGVLFAIHLVEGEYLSPKFVGSKVNINALASFLGLFAGGLLWGVWGMFLSVPILGVLRIALSVSPSLRPWGELLAEREDEHLSRRLIRRRKVSTPAEATLA